MPSIDIIAGARPNFMKIAPIIRALHVRQTSGSRLRYRLIHTGQHYDARMSGECFTQLGIPEPDVNLEVGSGTQAEQTAAIMVRYEALLLKQRSEFVSGGGRCHLHHGLLDYGAEVVSAGGACGRRHSLRRLVHA
ncbi:MAG: UDP-N-acetylglucosamine 2-epimerase [Nitrospira sp.]|nr:UDP-N-acetylglucosamine 2-epimerase [Nitrospira sp.]